MGLDISAYRLIERITEEEYKDFEKHGELGWENDHTHFWCSALIGYKEAKPVEGYWQTECLEAGRVGSYGRLHVFRSIIFEHVTGKPYPEVSCFGENREAEREAWKTAMRLYHDFGFPLFWLFNCSDCEGYFPPEICQKIVREMDEHPELIKKLKADSSRPWKPDTEPFGWYAIEQCFREAAKVGGVVLFH